MIRLKASLAGAPLEPLLERPVVEQAGQVVGPGPDLDRLEDLRVLEGDRDLGGEQLDELELLGGERVAEAEPLDGQDADGAVPAAQRHDDEAAVDGPPSSRNWLTRSSLRSSPMKTGSLCSTTQVAMPVSPGSHGSR